MSSNSWHGLFYKNYFPEELRLLVYQNPKKCFFENYGYLLATNNETAVGIPFPESDSSYTTPLYMMKGQKAYKRFKGFGIWNNTRKYEYQYNIAYKIGQRLAGHVKNGRNVFCAKVKKSKLDFMWSSVIDKCFFNSVRHGLTDKDIPYQFELFEKTSYSKFWTEDDEHVFIFLLIANRDNQNYRNCARLIYEISHI